MHHHDTPEVAALLHEHGGAWQIEYVSGLDVWSAVRKSPDGRHMHVLVARDPAALSAKITDAGDEDES
jgi:hypothetical protein